MNTNVNLTVGQRAELNVTVQVAATGTELTVTADRSTWEPSIVAVPGVASAFDMA